MEDQWLLFYAGDFQILFFKVALSPQHESQLRKAKKALSLPPAVANPVAQDQRAFLPLNQPPTFPDFQCLHWETLYDPLEHSIQAEKQSPREIKGLVQVSLES